MIKHIVFWRLKSREDEQSRLADARAFKQRIEAMRGKVPGLLHIEAGIDFNRSETACDVVLYSEFESRAALDRYQDDPIHQELQSFIGPRRSERRVVDYEV